MLSIDGTSAAPAYSFVSDSGLGLWRANTGVIGATGSLNVNIGTKTISPGLAGAFSPVSLNGTVTAALSLTDNWSDVYVNTSLTKTGGGGLATAYSLWFRSTVTSSDGSALITYKTISLLGSLLGTTGFTNVWGLDVAPTLNAPVATWRGVHIEPTFTQTPTTSWGICVESGMNSYHVGKFTFGGTTAPTWDIHVVGGNSAASGIGIDTSTTGPTAPASNGSGVISVYKGTTNYYLLVTFNDGGTTRYRYMQLNGTSATWSEATSLPT
jgi:hypothetical protein